MRQRPALRPSGSGCGVIGLQIESNPPGCVISLTEGAPGSSVSEVMTITNTSSSVYTLSLKAEGANNNAPWRPERPGAPGLDVPVDEADLASSCACRTDGAIVS